MAELLSPAGWLRVLESRLDERWAEWAYYDDLYEGRHSLSFATQKFREAFGTLFGALSDNWCPIVVDSSVERLTVQGIRFGDEPQADEDAWDIWQWNGLDAESDMLHTEAVKLGEAYWLVEPGQGDSPPRVTAEHPSQMIVALEPGDRRRRRAALKKWVDDDGFAYATVYLPDQVVKFRSESRLQTSGITGGRINWTRRPGDPGGRNPLGEVPVVPVPNNPSMLRGGRSDLQSVGPIQTAINKLLCDMIISSEYGAFPQRVLMGVDVPRGPDGQPVRAAELKSSQSRLWVFGNPDARVEQFSATNLSAYVETAQNLIDRLAAQTRTPPHYVVGKVANLSGDALKAAETGLVSKVRQKMSPFGEAHEEMFRLAFLAMGDEDRASERSAETIWADPESRSMAETVDAAVKLATIGVPEEVLWEKIGASPQEIDRWKAMGEEESLLAETPPVPPPAGQLPPPPEQPPQQVTAVAGQ